MKICPRCNKEFDEALENCLVCGATLTEYTPILSREERDALELNSQVTADMLEEINPENLPEVICSVVGKEEAERLVALMQEYRIPCMCKENGEEEDVFDLLIPKKKFNQALELLNEDEAEMEQEELGGLEEQQPVEEQEPKKESEAKQMKRLFSWLFK